MKLNTTKEYLNCAFQDAGVIELRHHNGKRWITGWFGNSESLLVTARSLASVGNLYVSLNAPKPRTVSNDMTGNPITDKDIGWIVRLPFDFDPQRPTGTCSTEEELNTACSVRDSFVSAMKALDWPTPLHAKSGNGYHAVYRSKLPANEETKEQLKIIYAGLYADFNTPKVSFDRTVRNAGRIFRLYGMVNRKGENTLERPHRKSTVWIPPKWRQVTQWQIDRLANAYFKAAKSHSIPTLRKCNTRVRGKGDYTSLDAVSWLQSHDLYLHPIEDNKHAVICPWTSEHTTESPQHGGDTIMYASDEGWPGFYCHHSHCEGRNIRDVMALFGDADRFCSDKWRAQQ